MLLVILLTQLLLTQLTDITNLATENVLNAIINEVKAQIPSINGLATSFALTAAENKIPHVSNLVISTYCEIKVNEIEKNITGHSHDKYIATLEVKSRTFSSKINKSKFSKKGKF